MKRQDRAKQHSGKGDDDTSDKWFSLFKKPSKLPKGKPGEALFVFHRALVEWAIKPESGWQLRRCEPFLQRARASSKVCFCSIVKALLLLNPGSQWDTDKENPIHSRVFILAMSALKSGTA